MNFGHGRSLKQFCEDEDYDYGKLQRYSRKAFWTKHTKLSESEVEGSGFMSLVHDDQQPSTTQTGDGPLPEGKGRILSGTWEDKKETELNISKMTEKPKASYAEEFLGVRCKDGKRKYMSVFGQYILTPEVFDQLHQDIMQKEIDGDHVTEIELTSALDKVREQEGMIGVQLQGRMYDMGNPAAFTRCVSEYSK